MTICKNWHWLLCLCLVSIMLGLGLPAFAQEIPPLPEFASPYPEPTPTLPQATRDIIIVVLVVVSIGISGIVFGLSGGLQATERGLWLISGVFSLMCFITIGVILYLTLLHPDDESRLDSPIYSPEQRDEFIQYYNQTSADIGNPAPIFIPTGVFIQSIKFEGAEDVTITGYIWQKYDDNLPQDILKGVYLPEGNTITGEEAYRHREGSVETIGWYFETTLRESFFYEQYPFDRQDIWLRMWHADFAKNIVLIPDFESYNTLNPYDFMGLEEDIVMSNWIIIRSFFSYWQNSYNTNFGISDYIGQDNFPELYFNVAVRRNFIDAFVANMIPPIVVLLMLFGVQILSTQQEDIMSIHGINTIGILTYAASLFFIAILSQLTLRSQVSARTVLYLEYFYFVIYIMCLWISVNAVLFLSSDHFWFIEYKDNLLPKLLFAPVVAFILLMATVITFY